MQFQTVIKGNLDQSVHFAYPLQHCNVQLYFYTTTLLYMYELIMYAEGKHVFKRHRLSYSMHWGINELNKF